MNAETLEAEPTVEAPVADDGVISDLYNDPFPIYRRLRETAPVHWVPAIGRYLVVGFSAIHTIDHDPETFTANEEGSLMIRAMGHSMLRKDDPEHAEERKALGSVLKPKAIKTVWNEVFQCNYERYLKDFIAEAEPDTVDGQKVLRADFHTGFAEPYAAENLREIIGFKNATWQDIRRWSQDMINATGNYADDPEIWDLGKKAFDEVDDAIDEVIPSLDENTLLAHMISAGMPIHSVRANIKMTIGGGFNEPRDAMGTTLWALLERPDQLAQVRQTGAKGWERAFDESVRWVAPIGMYSRQTTKETVLEGIRLPAGAKLGVNVGAANRDPAQFENPEEFDINREQKPHLGFGAGTHYCAGAWVARAQVARVGLPQIDAQLPGLARDPEREPRAGGWVFRGMLSVPVTWQCN
ncbi:cytochrome P450 [Nesterenkonia sp. MY13]|uniref:Cytochrome P450 n=1 Tax=Nesterenkonia sedimenti TaxID=1463632 RepID=A0A7X8YD33_9MICC|nr:cytochrome P450 [Nesterenkonia sedimenti]NLS09248.1 cytochrome P450 [Nesterenkonia sedimenti]